MRKFKRSFIPSLFTVLNLFSGFLAILQIIEKNYITAVLLIILAGTFDFLDGKIARWLHEESEFGIQIDSLADIVSFCAAPALLINNIYSSELGIIGNIISFFPLLFGAVRLARFNVIASTEPKKYFTGLPVPAAAVTIGAFVWFNYNLNNSYGDAKIALPLVVIISFLMITNIRFAKIPGIYFGKDILKTLKSIFILFSIIMTIIFGGLYQLPFLGAYIIGSIINWMIGYEDTELITEQ